MLAARGVEVSHETVRRWAEKFDREFTNGIRRRAPRKGDRWHLDEVVISIAGNRHWLWRAVGQDGFVPDVLVQSRRYRKAAKRLPRKLLKKDAIAPQVMVTDKLVSYGAARREMSLSIEHRQHKGLKNRAESSHQPTRRREGIMKRFRSVRQAQRFLSTHDPISNLFHLRRHRSTAADCRSARTAAFNTWPDITSVALSA